MNTQYFINEAKKEAIKAFKKNEVPVGCIIVKNNKIIAKAHNLKERKNTALAHAEIICIYKASKKLGWRLDNCSMYVTLEPCFMCYGAIMQSRIENLYYGTSDPKNNDLNKKLLSLNSNLKNIVNLKDDECSKLLKNFFKNLRNS